VFDRYNIFLPRKAVHSEFYVPARLDDRLRVATYVGRVGHQIHDPELRRAVRRSAATRRGRVDGAGVCGRRTLKPQPLPAGLVEALAPHTLTTAAARAILAPRPRRARDPPLDAAFAS